MASGNHFGKASSKLDENSSVFLTLEIVREKADPPDGDVSDGSFGSHSAGWVGDARGDPILLTGVNLVRVNLVITKNGFREQVIITVQ